jgi:iron(III) transport system permease protein
VDVARLRRHRGRFSLGLFAICAVVAILVLLPIAITVFQAFHGGTSAIGDALRASSTRTLLLNTVLVPLVATPICGVIGVGGAWFVERTQLPGRRIWAVLLVAPLTVPLFVTSYAWATLGVSLQGFVGAAGIIAFSYYPIVFLLVAVSLRGLDQALEDSARSLGLNPRQIFFRVVLPQLRPALLGGLLLVALDALVEFDAFVALRFQTFSLDVYAQYRLGFSTSGAAALSFFSIVLCVVVLFGEGWLRGAANYTRVSRGSRRPPVRYALGRWVLPVLAALAGVVAIAVGIPVAMLIRWFTESSSAALSTATSNLQYLWPASRTSILLGLGAALVALVMAMPVSLLVVRHGGRFSRLAERSTYLSFALPDLVGAIALSYGAVHYARFLYGSFTLIVFAEAVLFLPFAVVAMRATLGQIEPVLEDSARALGSGPLSTFRRVTMPVARPGIVAAIVLVFAFSLGDLATAQVLLPLNLYTLGTEFQANSGTVAFASAAPFAAVLIVLAMAAAWVLMSSFGTVRAFSEDDRRG